MNKEKLENVLERLLSFNSVTAAKLYIKSAGLVSACNSAASHCFVNQVPESDDTIILREALKNLNTTGSFLFQ